MNGWVSVDSALPVIGSDVLVCYEEGGRYVFIGRLTLQNGWQILGETYHVTHWMPLPEPPGV